MGTSSIFEKGEWLIAVTGMMQIIAVIVNNVACWTIIVVMSIIVTLENGALIVDNDSNCLCDSSDSNESSSFLNGSSTFESS